MDGDGDSARTSGEFDPLRKALTHSLAFWAVVVPVWMVVKNALEHQFAFDVHYAFVSAARAVLHGASPYNGVTSHAVQEGYAFLYPPLGAYLFAPFTLLTAGRRPARSATLLVAATGARGVAGCSASATGAATRCRSSGFRRSPESRART